MGIGLAELQNRNADNAGNLPGSPDYGMRTDNGAPPPNLHIDTSLIQNQAAVSNAVDTATRTVTVTGTSGKKFTGTVTIPSQFLPKGGSNTGATFNSNFFPTSVESTAAGKNPFISGGTSATTTQANLNQAAKNTASDLSNFSQKSSEAVTKFSNSQKDLYSNQLQKDLNSISNLSYLPIDIQQEQYNKAYNKSNQDYQKSVGTYTKDLIDRDLQQLTNKTTESLAKTAAGVSKVFVNALTLYGDLEKKDEELGNALKRKFSGASLKPSQRNFLDKTITILSDLGIANLGRLKSGKGLTSLEQEFVDKPVTTAIKLGLATLIAPELTLIGVGLAENPQIKEKISAGGRTLANLGTGLESPNLEALGIKNVGRAINIAGLGIQGVAALSPETSSDLDAFAIFELAGRSNYIPKIVKTLGYGAMSGNSGYNLLTGKDISDEERGKDLVIGLGAGLGGFQEGVPAFRKLRYRIEGTEKTNVGDSGIEKTDIDLGNTKINMVNPREAVMEITSEPLTVEYVPSQRAVFTEKIDPLKELASEINFKKKFNLPPTNEIQSGVLDVVKESGDVISGSFAQQALIKDARAFKDLDILSQDPEALAKLIKQRLGDKVQIEKKTITDSPLGEFDIYKVLDKKGNHIADLDPINFAEEGYAQFFDPVKVKGYNLLPPEVRLLSKVIQQSRVIPREKRLKVALDISQLRGDKTLAKNPALLRGYGISKEQQKAMFDEKELFLTHGGQGIIPAFDDEIVLKEGDFFSTPSLAKEGKAFARKSRMGMGTEPEYANFLDLLNPAEWEKIRLYPSAKNVVIERARLEKGKFEIPSIGSTEIEAVRKVPEGGARLKIEKRIKTIIEGEPVEIAYVREVKPKKVGASVKNLEIPEDLLRPEKQLEKKGTRGKKGKDESELKDYLERSERRPTEKILRVPQTVSPRRMNEELKVREPTSERRGRQRNPDFDLPRDVSREPDRIAPRQPEITPPRNPPREPDRDIPREPEIQPPRRPPREPPRNPPTEPPKEPAGFDFKKRRQNRNKSGEESYNVYIKEPRSKKFVKVTKNPVTSQDAKDAEAYFLDETTSRTGVLRRTKKSPSDLNYDIPKGYGGATSDKFRKYKIRQGKKIPLQQKIIERTPYLIDTRGEKKQLSIFKAMAKYEKKNQQKIQKSKVKSNSPVGLDFA